MTREEKIANLEYIIRSARTPEMRERVKALMPMLRDLRNSVRDQGLYAERFYAMVAERDRK